MMTIHLLFVSWLKLLKTMATSNLELAHSTGTWVGLSVD